MAGYEDRRQAALERLHELVAARRAWEDYNNKLAMEDYQQQKALYEQDLAKQKLAAEASKKNWFGSASKGAELGSVAGPWGTLIGAAAGTMYGQYQAIKERQHEGQNAWQAFGNTIGDTPFGFNVGAATIPGAGKGKLSWKDATLPSAEAKMLANRGEGEHEGYGAMFKDNTAENLSNAYGNSKLSYDRDKARRDTAGYKPVSQDYYGDTSGGDVERYRRRSIDQNSPSAEQYESAPIGGGQEGEFDRFGVRRRRPMYDAYGYDFGTT